MSTGYYHVVGDCFTVRRGDKYVNLYSSLRVVDHFDRNRNYSLLGSYKSRTEAEARKAQLEANQ